MTTATAEIPASATMELRNGGNWVRLTLSLSEPFIGGNVIRIAPDAQVELEGSDEASSAYTNANWLSGIASGAFYAFRTLKAPRRVVVVTELAGRLSAGDIQVLAYAAAQAIADLMRQELPLPKLDAWHVPATTTSANGTTSSS